MLIRGAEVSHEGSFRRIAEADGRARRNRHLRDCDGRTGSVRGDVLGSGDASRVDTPIARKSGVLEIAMLKSKIAVGCS
jgi:SH3-like domain-containing protein